MPLVDFKGLALPPADTPPSGHPWWFWGSCPILGQRRVRVSIDTGAMAVALSASFASLLLRAQDEYYEKHKGRIPEDLLAFSDLGRMEEQ